VKMSGPMPPDAMRWTPEVDQRRFPALLIPADPTAAIRVVDLGDDAYAGARKVIGCDLIEKVTVEQAGLISLDFLLDEEGSPVCRSDAVFNRRATVLGYAVRLAQFTGQYPAPPDVERHDLAVAAAGWKRQVRLYGPVVILGADERTGDWVPVPERLVEFAAEALDLAKVP
jgi:hypothetical protein